MHYGMILHATDKNFKTIINQIIENTDIFEFEVRDKNESLKTIKVYSYKSDSLKKFAQEVVIKIKEEREKNKWH